MWTLYQPNVTFYMEKLHTITVNNAAQKLYILSFSKNYDKDNLPSE